jgi:hypothetical protein
MNVDMAARRGARPQAAGKLSAIGGRRRRAATQAAGLIDTASKPE